MKFEELFKPKPGSLAAEMQKTIDGLNLEIKELRAHAERVGEANDQLAVENASLRATLDTIISADERAVELWRAAHPGNELVIPDRGRLVGWLLEQNDALRTKIAELEHFLSPKL